MPKGLSLNIGLNKIDPAHYTTAGRLKSPENDAESMSELAEKQGFICRVLLSERATRKNVIDNVIAAAENLRDGDFFLLTYSGHGGLLPNLNQDPEPIGLDQTLCLFDAQLVDDELMELWRQFRRGVRVLVISDSCFSGSILKFWSPDPNRIKGLDPSFFKSLYEKHRSFYDPILRQPAVPPQSIRATVVMLSSCKDNQAALDGPNFSVFTEELLHVWDRGQFNGNYDDFLAEIQKSTPSSQVPQMKFLGPIDEDFLHNKPFTL